MTHARNALRDTGAAPAGRMRVAVREIHETAYRALYAAGASTGEAACAAGTVTAMQVHDDTGIAALLTQMDTIDPARLRISVGIGRSGHGVVLEDPARREELFIGPLAVDLAVASAQIALVPHLTGHRILDWYGLDAAARGQTTLWVVGADATGRHTGTTVLTPDGRMYRDRALRPPTEPDLVEQCRLAGGAVAVFAAPLTAPAIRPVHTATAMARRYRNAVDHGTYVDAQTWSRAYALGRRFLIPEDTDD
jgi:hypothetical protein